MAYFDCIVGGSGKGNTLVVTCADDLAGATITCTNGTKTYTKTCPSTAPYEVTFYGLEAGTWTISATVSGDTYTTTVVITDYEAELGGFNWKAWVDLSENYASSDFTDLDDLLSDETAIRELMTIHACVDYLAEIAAESADVETIIGNDLAAKWINLRDYALDTLYANEIIAGYMDTADKYGYGELALMPSVPKMTSNTTPSGVASASSEYGVNQAPWKAFDGDDTTSYFSAASDTISNFYLGYDFASKVTVREIVCKYTTTGDTGVYNGYAIEIVGSNDKSTWTRIVESALEGSAPVATKKLIASPNEAYKYYRLRLTAGDGPHVHGQHALMIYALQFYAYAPKGNVPIMTANNAPYGEAFCSSNSSGYDAYKAFDKNASTNWSNSGSAVAGSYIGYHATNPIYVSKFKLIPSPNMSIARTWTVKVQASNDNSVWKDLTDDFVWDSHNEYEGTPTKNKGYYLYHRLYYVSGTSDNWANIGELQFYGRELSVSVPTMTGNTTPYGVAIKSSEYNESFPAWKAFSPTETYGWVPSASSLTNAYVGYEFTTSCVVKAIWAKSIGAGALTDIKLQGYDGTDWNDLLTFSLGQNVTKLEEVTNSTEYESYRVIGTFNTGGQGVKFQFYGLDYSEKEFEVGTTKKWLYDHGVQIEPLSGANGSSGVAPVFGEDSITLQSGSASSNSYSKVYPTTSFDLTSYGIVRAKIGDLSNSRPYIDVTTNPSGGTEIAERQQAVADLPFNLYLDISAIDQTYTVEVNMGSGSNGKCELKELWLE